MQQNLVQRNPVQGTQVEGRRTEPERYAYSLKEALAMVSALPRRAATVVAVAALTGLHEGEIRGLQWQDYDGESLNVSRSVWRTHVSNPKTESSEDRVPVIPSLQKILNEYRKVVPNTPADWIFAGERKRSPLNLANLVRREMLPAFKNGAWHGWHGFRRGLATRLHESGATVEIIQEILRHSDPAVTRDSYVVVQSSRTDKAMRRVDSKAVLNAWKKSR
jgi:integrase